MSASIQDFAIPTSGKLSKLLIIRRDNIGDLVLTTPLIHALRARWPNARIDVLVNSYNLPVLENNPDISNAYAYKKTKHRQGSDTRLRLVSDKLLLLWRLRRVRYERIILANAQFDRRSLSLAHFISPNSSVGISDGALHRTLIFPVPAQKTGHHVDRLWGLGKALGVTTEAGRAVIFPDPILQKLAKKSDSRPLIAVHLSSRKPSQRWSSENFSRLINVLDEKGCAVRVFWSPGASDDPLHPGDDEKAHEVALACPNIEPWPTQTLPELIASLSVCDGMVCSDGGHMHIAAALGLPIVALFGNSDVAHWHPWGVPYRVLQPESLNVSDLSAMTVLAACEDVFGI